MISIDDKIVGYEILKDTVAETQQVMHEKIPRPEKLEGVTYKVKTPLSEHALYITINDIVLNAGTPHELRRPYEIFVNSKNMEYYQWIVALTRIISAVFRKGGELDFLIEELRSVFDPRGGYFRPGGRYMPSLVAEIGEVIANHLKKDAVTASPPINSTRSHCPRCNSQMKLESGCKVCTNCGESKCE